MSLDVTIKRKATQGFETESGWEAVFDGNVTHNLGQMADAYGLYDALWRPDENYADSEGVVHASALIEPVRAGLNRLSADPEGAKKYNPANGWGDYEGLLKFTVDYFYALVDYPQGVVEVSR